MYCERCGKELKEGEVCQCSLQEINVDKSETIVVRTFRALKKVVKGIIWVTIGILLISGFTAKSGLGTVKDGMLEIVAFYINAIFIYVIPMLVLMNFMGVRNKLPLFKKRKFLVSVFAYFIMTLLLSMVCTITSTAISGLHTEEYQAEYKERQEQQRIEAEKKAAEELKLAEKEAEELNEEVKEESKSEIEINHDENVGENYQGEFLEPSEYNYDVSDHSSQSTEQQSNVVKSNQLPVYSPEYLSEYIDNHSIKMPKERYKSEMSKILKDNSNMTPLKTRGTEKIEYSATVEEGEYYYVGEMKNNKPHGWGKVIRLIKVYQYDMDGLPCIDIKEFDCYGEIVPVIVYMGEFNNGYYDGYGWKYFDHFEDNYLYPRKIEREYVQVTGDLYEDVLGTCNPIEYMGEFKKGECNGDGVRINYEARMLDEDFLYEDKVANREITFEIGEFKNGELSGECKIYLLGKLYYSGEYKHGYYNGKGTLYYPNSDQKQYSGEWRTGEYHGKGTLYNEDGTVKYKGKWKMGDYAN